jgi:UDP-N-acetylmuramate dehydrogenase
MLNIESNVSLKKYNTFGIDVNARYFAEVESAEDIITLFQLPTFAGLPKLILGGGSNVLFVRNFEGLVIKIAIKGIEIIDTNDTHVWVRASAGEVWHDFVLYCLQHNYAGVENLSLIPGTVGAAPIQNIGAYGVELNQIFESLQALEISTGLTKTFLNNDCKFGYRDSVFKQDAHNQYIILDVVFKLNKNPDFKTDYGDILKTLGNKEINIRNISDAVIKIRSSKLPNPAEMGNAGSFFKNPVVSKEKFEALKNEFVDMIGFELDDTLIKVSAAWLIERCGWKGKRLGNVGVHSRQALVLVNYGHGLGIEIKQLSEKIKASVATKFGIELQTEVNAVL